MINNREIYAMQKDLEGIKAKNISCDAHVPEIVEVNSTKWIFDTDLNMYKYIFNHGYDISKKDFVIKFYKDNESIYLLYSFIDNNSISIFSDTSFNLTIVVHREDKKKPTSKANYMENYYTKEEVYSKEETYSKEDTYGKSDTYSKQETYSKDEIYTKDETYAASELYKKDEVLNKEQLEKEADKSSSQIVNTEIVASEYMKYDTLYGNDTLNTKTIHCNNFEDRDNEQKYMFENGPPWLWTTAGDNNCGETTNTHRLFPELNYNGKCYGIHSDDYNVLDYFFFCEVSKDYKIIKSAKFKSDTRIYRDKYYPTDFVRPSVTRDTSYAIYDNKAYIVNGFFSSWGLSDSSIRGEINIYVVNLDTFVIESTKTFAFRDTEILKGKVGYGADGTAFVEIMPSKGSITILTNMFRKASDASLDNDHRLMSITITSSSSTISTAKINAQFSHGTVMHNNKWFFMYYSRNTQTTIESEFIGSVFLREYTENSSNYTDNNIYNFNKCEPFKSGVEICTNKCFDYFMYNNDGTLREDGIGARLIYMKPEEGKEKYSIDIIFDTSSSTLTLKETLAINSTSGLWSAGYKAMIYTGKKGVYASYMQKSLSGGASEYTLPCRQTITNGEFDTPIPYYDGILNIDDTKYRSSSAANTSPFMVWDNISWLSISYNMGTERAVLISPGYKVNDNQRFYWREDEKCLYLNINNEFKKILTKKDKIDSSLYSKKADLPNYSDSTHNHDEKYCKKTVSGQYISETEATCTLLEAELEALLLKIQELEGNSPSS